MQKLGRAGIVGRVYSLNLLEITGSVVNICAEMARERGK